MIKFEKFYVTTPIYYVNDTPHVGHAYTTIAADILARWHRLKGEKVFFLTGLDEHGQKIACAALEAGLTPQEFVDSLAPKFKKAWENLNIRYDDFIRTTEERHEKVVIELFNKINEKGDVYKGKYEGLYCEGCEQFVTEKDLENGLCPLHKTAPKKIIEENYFFKLSKYKNRLIEYIKNNPEFIQPEYRRNEVLSFLSEDLQDVSISRPNIKWGVEFPLDSNHSFWVWFDALVNYISADPSKWPATVQLMAKDIIRFHCVIWPAILLSAGYELPKNIFVHGFFTVEGQKMSKSLGNVVDPNKIVEKYGADAFRYFLFREVPFGQDGDFSEKALINRINSELADSLGNLVNRVLVLVEKNFDGIVPNGHENDKTEKLSLNIIKAVDEAMDRFEFNVVLNDIFYLINELNKYVNENKPWEIKDKEKLGGVLYNLLESLRIISILLYPFIPETAGKILSQIGLEKEFSYEKLKWGILKSGTKTKRDQILFNKIKV